MVAGLKAVMVLPDKVLWGVVRSSCASQLVALCILSRVLQLTRPCGSRCSCTAPFAAAVGYGAERGGWISSRGGSR